MSIRVAHVFKECLYSNKPDGLHTQLLCGLSNTQH